MIDPEGVGRPAGGAAAFKVVSYASAPGITVWALKWVSG